ncbi:MAG: YggS family pyridoxal phosphate-dependent enzyme [Phototrophicales bacterium]|nr:MAG: YggS family pyridoxal phosphate-dependent enzyme [Phototrophicales bacterium]
MSDVHTTTIQANIAAVRKNIEAACQRVGRKASEVTLVAVSKQHPSEDILAAYEAGILHFGENRVEEAQPKIKALQTKLSTSITWHMIGHVQSRKAREVAYYFDVIHSLDRLKLVARLDGFAHEQNRILQAYIQVNVSGEATKYGLEASHWEHSPTQRNTLWEFVNQLKQFTSIKTIGLMTMAPYEAEPEATRPVFAATRKLRDALAHDFPTLVWDHLSMGMTNDYTVAIEEGATLVRVGRAIFGERTY